MKVNPETLKAIERALADGSAVVTGGDRGGDCTPPRSPEMVEPAVLVTDRGVSFTIPVTTVSEANQRGWKGKAARAGSQRRAVSRAVGPHLRAVTPLAEHYHAGRPLDVVITRLGGRPLDALSNLGAALKAVEDAVCLVIGADDGDPRWRARAAQEPGGPVGVRVELRTGEE